MAFDTLLIARIKNLSSSYCQWVASDVNGFCRVEGVGCRKVKVNVASHVQISLWSVQSRENLHCRGNCRAIYSSSLFHKHFTLPPLWSSWFFPSCPTMEEGRSSRSQDTYLGHILGKIYKNRGNNAWGTGFRVRAPGNHRGNTGNNGYPLQLSTWGTQ